MFCGILLTTFVSLLWVLAVILPQRKMRKKRKELKETGLLMDQNFNIERVKMLHKIAIVISVAASIAAVVFIGVVVVNYMYGLVVEPALSDELAEWKLMVTEHPGDEKIVAHVRELDLKLRQLTFSRFDRTRKGSILLVCSLGLLFVSLKYALSLSPKLPQPQGQQQSPESQELKALWSRRAVTATMIVAGCGAIFVFIQQRPDFTDAVAKIGVTGGQEQPGTANVNSWPTPEEINANWATFRGPGGLGVRDTGDYPTTFDGNVLWKTPVPMASMSSPVVWNDRIFLTGADDVKREVYCYDAASGKMLWTGDMSNVAGSAKDEELEVMEDTGFAAPTPVTDGKHVCAIFATGDIGCFDYTGKRVWAKNLGRPDSIYGYASSLTMYKGNVIVQYDQGHYDDGISKLIALDFATGAIAWQTKRPVSNSWASPTVVTDGKKDMLLTSADPFVIAYDPAGGKELWRAECVAGDVASTQILVNGLVLAIEPYSQMAAIRASGAGNITETHVAWLAEDGIPDICSPISNGKEVFLLETEGLLTCFNMADGKMVWEKELDKSYQASPSIVSGKMYLLSTKGEMLVTTGSGEFTEVARSSIDEGCSATPAFAGGHIYIRTVKNLYCIGKKD